MSSMPTMTFPFAEVTDAHEMTAFRPIVSLRPEKAPLDRREFCLVDTGSPNTFLDSRLASAAGINLDHAEKIPDPHKWAVGGVPATAL
jgi:hypothetical protein